MSIKDRFKQMEGRGGDEAGFYWQGGPVEVAERTYFQSRFSGVTAFDTDEGIVLVDSGTAQNGPKIAEMLREKTAAPIHTFVITHGHADHAYGIEAFLVPGQPRPRVIAHQGMPARFARYELTSRFNAAINARQFGASPAQSGEGEAFDNFRLPPLMPDTLYDDHFSFRVGGVTFEVHHSRGETDDHSWVWCPDRSVIASGDMIISVLPNAGNPQKVQRYPWDWAKGLQQMAGLNARTLCPGHGAPTVENPDKVRKILLESASILDTIVDRTLAAMAKGAPPHTDIVHMVELPTSNSPWLQPIYDEAEFIVRNVIRYYGGWWNGRPSDLKPASRSALAQELARCTGGARALIGRAEAIVATGDMRLACHLADYAMEAAPSDPDIRDAVAKLYELRAAGESSLMSESLYKSAAVYAREGRAFV